MRVPLLDRLLSALTTLREWGSASIRAATFGGRLGSDVEVALAQWQAGEVRPLLLAGGWKQVRGRERAAAIETLRRQTPDDPTLIHLLGAPVTPEVLRSADGKLLALEPEGKWPRGVGRPNYALARPLLEGLVMPDAPVRAEVLDQLAHTLPIAWVRCLDLARIRLRESNEHGVNATWSDRLGPVGPGIIAGLRYCPSEASCSLLMRQVRVQPGLPPAVAAALFRHEIAHLLIYLAAERGLFRTGEWESAFVNAEVSSARGRQGFEEFIAESLASFVTAQPLGGLSDSRLIGRQRFRKEATYELAREFLAKGVLQLLKDKSLAPRSDELTEAVERWYGMILGGMRNDNPLSPFAKVSPWEQQLSLAKVLMTRAFVTRECRWLILARVALDRSRELAAAVPSVRPSFYEAPEVIRRLTPGPPPEIALGEALLEETARRLSQESGA